ncbi:MAG: GspE/PulE family protein [Porticoccaceae bacterium]|nr:GspE/PulE family protein [Porticoccaceae bacterium]HLS97709.1 GspE/PulE family protein [Porticoccaceae bacterium]
MTPNVIKSAQDLAHLQYGLLPETEIKLGLELVKSGIITQEQLKEAIKSKRDPRDSLVTMLENAGVIDRANRPIILASRLGIPVVRINEMSIEHDIIKAIPSEIILRYQVLPLGLVDNHLIVAISDPANTEAIHTLNFVSERHVDIVIAPARDISQMIERHVLDTEEEEILVELNNKPAADESHELSVQMLKQNASERPIVKFVDSLLHRSVLMGASDINLRPTEKGGDLYFRIDGKLILQRNVDHRLFTPIVSRIKIMSGMDIAERRLPQDGATMVVENNQRIDFRVSVIPTINGESVVIRVLDKTKGLVGLDALGLPAHEITRMRKILTHSFGIFLVTGPTGSGKSTTLYAVLNERNQRGVHIITVEDPVEYRLDGIEQIQIKPQIGYTFAEALRHILRHDPDEILIGEMRDFETAEIAIKASLTGHFVMSTLHTNDAPSSVTRLIDTGIEPYLINSTVVGVLAQRLVRRICKHCKEPDPDPGNLKAYFKLPEDFAAYRGKGCFECHQTGYKGRMMVGELLEMSTALRTLISQRANADALRDQAMADGMSPLASNALMLVQNGDTTLAEAFAVKLE